MSEKDRAQPADPEKEIVMEESSPMGRLPKPPISMRRWEQPEGCELRPRAVQEELAELRKQASQLGSLANDAHLAALGRYSAFYQEVRQGYLDAEVALRRAAERIEAKTHD